MGRAHARPMRHRCDARAWRRSIPTARVIARGGAVRPSRDPFLYRARVRSDRDLRGVPRGLLRGSVAGKDTGFLRHCGAGRAGLGARVGDRRSTLRCIASPFAVGMLKGGIAGLVLGPLLAAAIWAFKPLATGGSSDPRRCDGPILSAPRQCRQLARESSRTAPSGYSAGSSARNVRRSPATRTCTRMSR